MLRCLLILPVIFFTCSTLFAQPKYPTNYFSSPIDTVIRLAGNFGEIRLNHFHSGLDIKTGGKEGMKIYSIAEGYVSRIKVSAFGYGKTLYITHPNGYVSVYAHLQRFADIIENYVKRIQYEKQSFEIELFPFQQEFPLKKGEIIAFSGNTGSSEGAHLHFEIRDDDEVPINPLLFGLNVSDTVKPFIAGIAVYPLNKKSSINNQNIPKKIKPLNKKGIYSFKPEDTVNVSGAIGFGIEAYDTETGSKNRNAVYSVELYKDGKLKYSHLIDKVSFDDTRYVNAHIDYPEKLIRGKTIQKSFLSENNKLNIYHHLDDKGKFSFDRPGEYLMKYVVKDVYGNKDSIEFWVKTSANEIKIPQDTVNDSIIRKHFECEYKNELITSEVKAKFPKDVFYDDLEFMYFQSKDTLKGALTPIHIIGSPEVPLQNYYELKIKCPVLTYTMKKKALIVSLSGKSSKISEGGEWENDYVVTKTRTLGKFTVVLDTLAPVIKPVYFPKNKILKKGIYIQVKDDLSGLKDYKGMIDGKWILLEYDYKKKLLFYLFDESISPGKHLFELEVADEKGNINNFKTVFIKQEKR